MRFYTSYTNRRHKGYGAGILPGDPVHTRGWNAGVSVTAQSENGGRDGFTVTMTTGSHDSGGSVHLGTVHDTPEGPRWDPAARPGKVPARVRTAGHPSDRYAMPVVAAIPMESHLDKTDSDEYACVVISGRWASSRELTFGAIIATRDGDGWVTESRAYDMGPLGHPRSLVSATTEMIRLAGYERPSTRAARAAAEMAWATDPANVPDENSPANRDLAGQ